MCDVLDVSRSSFYDWLNKQPFTRTMENQILAAKISVGILMKAQGLYSKKSANLSVPQILNRHMLFPPIYWRITLRPHSLIKNILVISLIYGPLRDGYT